MPLTITTRLDLSTGGDVSQGTAEADAYRRSLERSFERFTPRQTHEINISPPITPGLWKPPGGSGAGSNTPEARAREEEARAEGASRIQRSRDFNDYVDLSQGRTTQDRPRTTGNFPNIERIPDLEWTRSTRSGGSARNSRSGGGASWARNIDFGGGSSAAEAVVNDLIQQIAAPYFEDATRDSQRAYDDLVNQTRSNFENSVDALSRLVDDFQEAIDNIPEPQPLSLPNPSLLCRHFIEYTIAGTVDFGEADFWLADDTGSATISQQTWIWDFDLNEYVSIGSSSNPAFSVAPGTRPGDAYPGMLIQHSNSSGDQTYGNPRFNYYAVKTQLQGELPTQAGLWKYNFGGIGAFRIGDAPIDWEIGAPNMWFGGGCTPEDQEPPPTRRRPPIPREREDPMQCLAGQLVGRLDRIIALLEHNVLTEAQIDQIAASAKGLKAQTKTLKALKQNMAVPEFWELKPGIYPQAAIVFGNKLPNGKIGRERRTLHIPHYRLAQGQKPTIPEYDRGSYWARLILKDNSKIYCYAKSANEAVRVVNALAVYAKQSLLPGIQPTTGKVGYAKSDWKAVPLYLQYYSDAKKGMFDWQVDLD